MDEADRPGAHGVADDRRQPRPDVVQLLDQRQRAPEHAPPARNPGGRHQHESPHPIRLLGRELRRHQPTQRMRENVHPPEPDGIEQTPQPRRHLPRTQAPQPRQLHKMKPALRKPLHKRQPPPPRARQSVHHHQVLALPHHPKVHRPPVNLDAPQLHTTSLQHHPLGRKEVPGRWPLLSRKEGAVADRPQPPYRLRPALPHLGHDVDLDTSHSRDHCGDEGDNGGTHWPRPRGTGFLFSYVPYAAEHGLTAQTCGCTISLAATVCLRPASCAPSARAMTLPLGDRRRVGGGRSIPGWADPASEQATSAEKQLERP